MEVGDWGAVGVPAFMNLPARAVGFPSYPPLSSPGQDCGLRIQLCTTYCPLPALPDKASRNH